MPSPSPAGPAAPPPPPAHPDMVLLGWAGLLLPLPRGYRLAAIQGDDRRGSLTLADGTRNRLEIAWGRVVRDRFDPRAAVLRQLVKAAGKTAPDQARPVDNPAFDPLLLLIDQDAGLDRLVGYSPATGRIIECAYTHDRPRADALIRHHTYTNLIDQPQDASASSDGPGTSFEADSGLASGACSGACSGGAFWSFFDCSFVSPPGYVYASATLNLGDMTVTLSTRASLLKGPWLSIGQVYPASLALTRQDEPPWLDAMVHAHRDRYRRRWGLLPRFIRPRRDYQPTQTAAGDGLRTRLPLRFRCRALFWHAPRSLSLWVIHDRQADRLLRIAIAHRPEEAEKLLDEILRGLHWARRPLPRPTPPPESA